MKTIGSIFFLILVLLASSCRSKFEQIRTSNDATAIYESANNYYDNEDFDKAITLYELIIPAFRGRSQAEDIAFKFAMAHYLNGSYMSASHYFKSFSDTFGASSRKEEAMFLSAFSNYKLSPRYRLDQSASQKAIDAFQIFVNTYPQSDRVAACNQYIDQLRIKMETKAFDSGKLYFQTRNYSSAIQSLENMLRDFPDSNLGEEARYLIVKASLDWADNSIYTRQEERYKKTVERCNLYLKKHRDSERTEQVLFFKDKCEQEIKSFQNG